MNLKKIGAVAASALIMTTMALSASAAGLPNVSNTGAASVKAVDVDLSSIDWENIQPGELKAIGPVSPDAVNGGTTTAAADEDGAIGVATLVPVDDVDLSDLDLTNLVEGELVVLGPVSPDAVNGSAVTAAKK